ncbi:MAG: hypothetical protein ACK55I_12330, partial [bacterium]
YLRQIGKINFFRGDRQLLGDLFGKFCPLPQLPTTSPQAIKDLNEIRRWHATCSIPDIEK